jgi:hypothetical protein
LLILAAASITAPAQSLVEHAAIATPAAAGSSTGAAIGSALSATLDNAAQKAATPPRSTAVRPRTSAPVRAVETQTRAEAPLGPKIVWRRGMERQASLIRSGAARPGAPAPAPAPSPARLSSDDIAARLVAVAPGMTRQQLLSQLGAPAYTIAMTGDDGRQIERMRFRAMGEDIASVEIRDGLVSSVTKRAP